MKHLQKKWNQIIEDYEHNVTRIYGRPQFHRVFDVVAHSVLNFRFKGQYIERGWVEAGIFGDTRTGKSEVALRLSLHCGIAKPFDCELVSIAGIIGGVNQVGGRFHLTWGAAPRLDRRMMGLDETTGLTTEQISSMSGMRSTGVASIMKISGGETMARVRKLWLANPRTKDNRNVEMSSYPFGVLVIPPIIGRAEDIARFDVITIANKVSVPLSLINAKTRKAVRHKHISTAAKALIFWAWTRKADDVVFQAGVEDLILDIATAQCGKYSAQIPLVEPGEQRIRVARIAVAIAARFFSTDKGMKKLIVTKDHAKLAQWFFEDCYDNEHTGYLAYSQQTAGPKGLDEKGYQIAASFFKRQDKHKALVDAFAFAADVERIQVMDYQKRSAILGEMLSMGLLHQGTNGLQKTKRFTEFYKRWSAEGMK